MLELALQNLDVPQGVIKLVLVGAVKLAGTAQRIRP